MNLQLKPTKTVLVAYSGVKLKPEGTVLLECSMARSKANLQFYVSNHSETAVLGKNACETLGLIKRMDIDTLTIKYPMQVFFMDLVSSQVNITSTSTPQSLQSFMAAERYRWQLWIG